MKNPAPVFPPFSPRQIDLLEELKKEIESLKTLPPCDPETGTCAPEFYGIQKRIDELSVKALRFALKPHPAESRRPGFVLEVPTYGGRMLFTGDYEIKPGFGDFHPDLPLWAKDHFVEWIQILRAGLRRYDARDVLRETKIVGIETGTKPPLDLTLLMRVLELREFKEEENPADNDAKQQCEAQTQKKSKRTRKERRSWDWVIKKLLQEGLLQKVITHQALKKKLKRRYPEWPWEKI